MPRMSRGQGESPERAEPTELHSRRKRRVVTAPAAQFERAFADALRDILRDEMRLAS